VTLALLFVNTKGHEERHELAVFRDELLTESEMLQFDMMFKSVSLTANPTLLTISPSNVTVKISGVSKPTLSDTLAIFSPGGNIDFHQHSPIRIIKFVRLAPKQQAIYLKTGSLELDVAVFNLHANVSFALFLDVQRSWITGSNRKVLAARSNVISWNNLNQPSQGRLALTKKVGEMSVI